MSNNLIFTIGRSADNHLIVDQPGVSRQHARVTFITDNEVMLEDIKSTNGTFVDGRRISRTIINPQSRIIFGHSEPIDPQRIFNLKYSALAVPVGNRRAAQPSSLASVNPPASGQAVASPPPAPADGLDCREKFKRLANLQETYTETREQVQINGPKRQGWLRAILGLVPLTGIFLGKEGIILGVVGSVVGQIVAVEMFNPTKKLLTLDKEFKRDYVCPSCGTFLGNTPYSDLVRRRQCRECKAKWAD